VAVVGFSRAAPANPLIIVIGRMQLTRRAGYDLDIERVLALVPTMGVAVEVNGNLLHRVTGSHRREAVVLPTQHSPERPIPDPAAVTSRSP